MFSHVMQHSLRKQGNRFAPLSSGQQRLFRVLLAVSALTALQACAPAANRSLPQTPDMYDLPAGSVQPGDIHQLSNGSLMW